MYKYQTSATAVGKDFKVFISKIADWLFQQKSAGGRLSCHKVYGENKKTHRWVSELSL